MRVAMICRHPVKAMGREEMARVLLTAGECLPDDRRWAVAHEAARLVPGWNPCTNFARGAKAPSLMAITSTLDGDRVTLSHPDRPDIAFRPDDPDDLAPFLDWLGPLLPEGRAAPVGIVSAGRAMTDSGDPFVSILSRASLDALSTRAGRPLSEHRFRANLWIEGAEPFAEFGWIGRSLRIGEATLYVEERITRCRATMADPATGEIDVDTLALLEAGWGHRDFGVFARVVQGGAVALGDPAALA